MPLSGQYSESVSHISSFHYRRPPWHLTVRHYWSIYPLLLTWLVLRVLIAFKRSHDLFLVPLFRPQEVWKAWWVKMDHREIPKRQFPPQSGAVGDKPGVDWRMCAQFRGTTETETYLIKTALTTKKKHSGHLFKLDENLFSRQPNPWDHVTDCPHMNL